MTKKAGKYSLLFKKGKKELTSFYSVFAVGRKAGHMYANDLLLNAVVEMCGCSLHFSVK